jgi:hypothetical protein
MKFTNPLEMIKDDHEKVKAMLSDYRGMDYEDKKNKADKIGEELLIHVKMEEELFYPKLREADEEAHKLVEDAISEHDQIKEEVKMCFWSKSEEDLDQHIEAISESVEHHTAEEEGEMFRFAEEHLSADFSKMAAEMGAFKIKAKGEKLYENFKEKL